MGKLARYSLIMFGTVLLFYFAGLLDQTVVTGPLLTILLNPSSISISTFFNNIYAGIAGVSAIGVTLGLLFINREMAAFAPVTIFFGGLSIDFVYVVTKVYSSSPLLATFIILILSPFMVIFGLTLIDWLRGRD